ncbi:uncharacterized protein LOC135931980 isoform X2 [Gordionus sp. m RMFG-2023]|uniref:uncharacterized protein LOC135931980 isoform X1 n=1 Tax=Gordionus sp. m RMFG-2023 TaxID=3053472 RepID=UPI0031FD6F3E
MMDKIIIKTLAFEETWNFISTELVERNFSKAELYIRYHVSKDGWLGALDEHNNVIGLIYSLPLDSEKACIGWYYVKNQYRGKGFGRLMYNKMMGYLGNRIISLNASPKMLNNYLQNGMTGPYFRVSVYQTKKKLNSLLKTFLTNPPFSKSLLTEYKIISARDVAFYALCEYDTQVHGNVARETYLRDTIDAEICEGKSYEKDTYVCLRNKFNKGVESTPSNYSDYEIVGYGVLIRKHYGFSIAPYTLIHRK